MILSTGIIYLYGRPGDYLAHFTVKTTPDIVYYNIHNWNFWNRIHLQAKIEVINNNPVSNISQKVLLKDTTLIFNWKLISLSDSVTMVRVYVSDPERRFFNRLTVPFKNTAFKKSVRGNLLDIKARLELMLSTFHYEFTGLKHFEKKNCVYVSIKCPAREKARAMMMNVAALNQFVRQNNLELDGNPFLVVDEWSVFSDSIRFDFCFPVKQTEAVPQHPEIKFKTVDGMPAIKTNFFGNYSISDISWYNLTEEAKQLGYRSNNKLIEVYLNDPHNGGNELEWKAEIFLGIESNN